MTTPDHDAGPAVVALLPGLDPRGRPARVSLLTRTGCHLCRQAVAAVERVCDSMNNVGYVEVDIEQAATTDPQVRARYGEWVPVTFVDGAMHDYFTVDPERLRASLTES